MVIKRVFCVCLAAACVCILLLVAGPARAQDLSWYRGNTHAHTNRGDAYASPDEIAAWYLGRGYSFLCITDHNMLTSPGEIRIPEGARKDFILIPSEEITGPGHATAMNIKSVISSASEKTLTDTIQKWKEETEKVGGIFIVNHPNYQWAVKTENIREVRGLRLFELYNCYPVVNNEGDNSHPSTESMWDMLLTDGMEIYGVASDDTHSYVNTYSAFSASPGKGWVMVQAKELSPTAICDALLKGRFYASIGVILSRLEMSAIVMTIEIDKRATEAEIAKGTVFGRPAQEGSKVSERIDFIGNGGKILRSFEGLSATYTPVEKGYVRARAVITRVVRNEAVEYCAWAQPVFVR